MNFILFLNIIALFTIESGLHVYLLLTLLLISNQHCLKKIIAFGFESCTIDFVEQQKMMMFYFVLFKFCFVLFFNQQNINDKNENKFSFFKRIYR